MMSKDDLKFLASFVATLMLAAFVIYTVFLRDLRAAAGPSVDLEKIERLEARGIVSLHEESHWEKVQGGRR